MQEEVLLHLNYVFSDNSYNNTIKKISTIEEKLKQLNKSKMNIAIGSNSNNNNNKNTNSNQNKLNKTLKSLVKPLNSVASSLHKIGGFLTSKLKTIASSLLKFGATFTGALSVMGFMQQNKATAGMLDELKWQDAKSKTAFRYMNVAAQSNLVDESGVASEIQELMKQQRQFKTTGVASDSNLQAMMAQFGLSLGDSIDDILNKLDSRRKVMGDTQYYTLMESIGKGNIARAQIEGGKMKNVPELYSMGRAEKTAGITRKFNKMTATLKDDAFKVFEKAIPLIEKVFNGLSRFFNFLTPILISIVNLVDSIIDKLSNTPVVSKIIQKIGDAGDWVSNTFNKSAEDLRNGGNGLVFTPTNNNKTINNYNVNNPSFAKNVVSNVSNHTNNTNIKSGLDMSFN